MGETHKTIREQCHKAGDRRCPHCRMLSCGSETSSGLVYLYCVCVKTQLSSGRKCASVSKAQFNAIRILMLIFSKSWLSSNCAPVVGVTWVE